MRKIIFVTDVAVLTIETIKLIFKLIFLKQFHFLKPSDISDDALEIGEKGTSTRVYEKGNTEGRERGCR